MHRTPLHRLVASLCLAAALAAGSVGVQAASAPTPSLASEDGSATARWIGFYQPGAPQSIAPLTQVESKLGVHVGVTNFFRSVQQPFTAGEVDNAAGHDAIPLITLEMCAEGQSGVTNQPGFTLKKITAGALDATLHKYAAAARQSGHEVWIRPFHEMNGYWYPWGGTANGNTPADFVPAWRHVHDIFAQEGATNVKFVWCPNIESLPSGGSNAIGAYYPGDAYVDYMALDGYNFSTTIPQVHWRSFADLFDAPYDTLCGLSAAKPIFVAETASVSCGGDKPAWISAMFASIATRFPRVVGVDWFNSANSRQDWPVDSSSVALQSFRLGVANGSFSPGLALRTVPTSLSIKASAKSVKRKHAIKFSGMLTPGQRSDPMRVTVTLPNHHTSWRAVKANSAAAWSFSYTPTKRGTYYVRAKFAGDSNRYGSSSKTIRFTVK